MKKLTIIGVPEHFNFPWLQVIENQPFMGDGVVLIWKDEPKGSGAMNKAIREEETDIAIILTESFIKDKVEGNPGKIIGFHVESPLIWGIHVPVLSSIERINSLKEDMPFLVSRMGSGSHLMAYLLAKKEGWNTEELKFEIVGDLEGAKKAFKNPLSRIFLWEKFTTQPLVDKGLFRRVGELPTPWPCFVIVASARALKEYPVQIENLRDLVYGKSGELMSKKENTIKDIVKQYDLKYEDVKLWLDQTTWATNNVVNEKDLVNTMGILKELSLISRNIPVNELVEEKLVKI